jgi:hypothetical protein
VGAPHPAVLQELGDGEHRRVAGDREADALSTADHRGVDADHLAACGYQRAAGIARIERRVGLDDVIDQAAALGAQGATECRHHAGGDARLEAERIPDRHHQMSAPQPLGVAESGRRYARRQRRAQQREIGVGIVPEHDGLDLTAFGEGEPRAPSACHHVAVGQDEPVLGNHHAGTDAAPSRKALHTHDGRADAVGDGRHDA